MEPERWRQIEDLFQAALDCEPSRRDSLLDQACAGDPPLRDQIESLLASYEKDGFTGAPAFADGLRLLEKKQSDSLAGRRIGPYRVIREIGHGGMGAVYLAARADEAFRKDVAIKLIKRGLDTESVIHRFRGERQILASLDHPNITRLLDGGTTEDGSPYFVMEYIQGEPIDKYCDAQKLNTAERLRLFQSVCAAIHYAHQNLVIHRDIKPGNVLVTAEGVPRLLDFGIAKLLNRGLAPQAADTMTAAPLMTPQYASPEQVRGETITVASDVYSLGVLLYELLTGHRPYRVTGRPSGDIERSICEEEPERPSAAAGRVLGRRLRGDLDNIVLMAMRKEAQRRYGSVEQLSEDIRRHLDGLPVIARPDTPGYRAAKFIGRHTGGVAAAALIFLTLAVGIVATSRQARVAGAERDRALLEKVKAERINAFLQDMLSFSDRTWQSANARKEHDATVTDVLEDAAGRVETELADQPEVMAAMQRTIGNTYASQSRLDLAEHHLRAALDTHLKLFGQEHQETARSLHDLGVVLFTKGDRAGAEMLFRQALAIHRRRRNDANFEARWFVMALADLALTMREAGQYQEAESLWREGMAFSPGLSGRDRPMAAIMMNNLATMRADRGDLQDAETLARKSIEEYRKMGYVRGELGAAQINLGNILRVEGRYAEAEPLIREGVASFRRLLGEEHPNVAYAWVHSANLHYLEGDYGKAEEEVRRALKIYQQSLPKGHPRFSTTFTVMGLILNKTGRSAEAESKLREALQIGTRTYPKGHYYIAITQGALGECLTTQKRYDQAEPFLTESYAAMRAAQGDKSPLTAEALGRLVTLYEAWGKPQDAARYRSAPPQSAVARPLSDAR